MAELRRAGLEGTLPWQSADGSILLSAERFTTQIGVRRRGRASAYLAGLPLPLESNRVALMGAVRVLWLGPDEWLITAPDGEAPRLLPRLARIESAAATDLSASRAVIALAGRKARALLEKGCGLDLHPRAFGPGHCAQTLLARVPVIIDQLSLAPAYRIFVRRSMGRWLCAWMMDAASPAIDRPEP